MRNSSCAGRKSQESTKSFQFKTVSFSDSAQPEQAMSPPLGAEPLPFIITQNGKTPSKDSSLIRRTVMRDFVSKERNQTPRDFRVQRSQTSRTSPYHQELHPTRSQDKDDQHTSIQVASGSRSSWPVNLPDGAEAFEGYALVGNETLISIDSRLHPDLASVQDTNRNLPSLLGPLGAGRVDPFESFPTRYKNKLVTSQLLDHCNSPFLSSVRSHSFPWLIGSFALVVRRTIKVT
jgi:hypothetical protein